MRPIHCVYCNGPVVVDHPARLKVWRDSLGRRWYRVAIICVVCSARDMHMRCMRRVD